jgi:hypothetical protein
MTGFASKRMMASDPITGHWKPKWTTMTQSVVDDDLWYQIGTAYKDIAEWIRTQPSSLWYEHPPHRIACFDIHEKLYTIFLLKWS